MYCPTCRKEVIPNKWKSQPINVCPDCGNVLDFPNEGNKMINYLPEKIATLISTNRIGEGKEEQACDKDFVICGDCLTKGFIKLFKELEPDFNEQDFLEYCYGYK